MFFSKKKSKNPKIQKSKNPKIQKSKKIHFSEKYLRKSKMDIFFPEKMSKIKILKKVLEKKNFFLS